VFSPDRIETRLSVFDTHDEKFLNTPVDVGNCDYSDFIAASAPNHLGFLCGSFTNSNRVRFVWLDASSEVSSTSVELPITNGCGGLAEAFPLSGAKMGIVGTNGAVYEMDLTTQRFSPTSARGGCLWIVAHAEWPRSSDGAKLYLGYGGVAPNGMSAARELRVFDTATWAQSGHVATSVSFWSAVASQDGKYIYATSPERHVIVVLDAESLAEKRVVAVGTTPSLAIVAPKLAR
jgi:hypothetical protein